MFFKKLFKKDSPFITKREQLPITLEEVEYGHLAGNLEGREISLPHNSNILVVGGTGTGKTHNYIKSNLLQPDFLHKGHSAVVIDTAGLLYKEYGNYFREKGYLVYPVRFDDSDIPTSPLPPSLASEIVIAETAEFLTNELSKLPYPCYVFVQLNPRCINPYLNDLLHQIIEKLFDEQKEKAFKRKTVHFYLDEFAVFNIPKFNYFFTAAHEHNIGFSIIVQTIEQIMDELYRTIDENTDTIICTRAMLKKDLDFLVTATEKRGNFDEMITMKAEIAKLFSSYSNGNKQLVIRQNKKPIVCDKLNPDDYKR